MDILRMMNEDIVKEGFKPNDDLNETMNTYKRLEEDNYYLENQVEIKESILKDNLVILEELPDEEIIYQDVNLDEIAKILENVFVIDLYNQLGYYGTWQIAKVDEMNYLINYSWIKARFKSNKKNWWVYM